ncbi:hypothetical protein Hamer_G014514 [Homarus americanus]|uniref:Uncharacterized protein n=1 Tax=Homarus americanus TaxID=6706 RepID=A0A8J5N4J3_HOMAM|nr:hypothetical protein Hamer_G014514 [Homarus americanus]
MKIYITTVGRSTSNFSKPLKSLPEITLTQLTPGQDANLPLSRAGWLVATPVRTFRLTLGFILAYMTIPRRLPEQQQDRRNYTDKELINDMIVPLLHQWTKANALFKPPVINQCRTIELKLTKLWHKAVETSLGKGNLARKNEFLHTLDTLFDILTCKCSIQLCSESNCSHSGKRENNSHIDCGCPREKKIPVLELEFIKAQRTKAEGQGSMQMGSIDYSETKKQIANAKKREQIREREQKKKMKSEEAIQREEELCQDVYHFFDSSSDEQEATSDDIPPINVNATKLSELVDLSLEVLEPPLTTSLTSQELRNLKETPMQVPKWPSHTQSVERCVKMVTEAAGHVYSHERREVVPFY